MFWATWAPFCLVMGMSLGVLLAIVRGGTSRDAAPWVLGVGSFFLFFNIFSGIIRWRGFQWGYRSGREVAQEISRVDVSGWVRRTSLLGLAVSLALFLVLAGTSFSTTQVVEGLLVFFVVAVFRHLGVSKPGVFGGIVFMAFLVSRL